METQRRPVLFYFERQNRITAPIMEQMQTGEVNAFDNKIVYIDVENGFESMPISNPAHHQWQ